MKKKKAANELPVRLQNELAIQSQDERFTTVKHFANLGDAVAIMAAIKTYWEITKRKVVFCQMLNQPAAYYNGATHPTVDSNGRMVCQNETMFSMLKPLLESQEYILRAEPYQGQHIDLDFDVIRGKTFVGMPNLMLQSWIMFAYPDLACDLSKAWIHLPEVESHPIRNQVDGKVIINFTDRYRSEAIDYFFLRNYAPDLVFAGNESEYFKFCSQWNLNIPRLAVNDFLEYAYAIKYARFFVGCQSFGINIAESMKTPRVVELCRFAPNIQPMVGERSYGYFHQVAAEYYFRRLYNETTK
jgi:hypothetical protein